MGWVRGEGQISGLSMAQLWGTVGYTLRPGESSHVAAIRAALEAALAVRDGK